MRAFALALLLLQAPTAPPPQREIIGPYTFREDKDNTTKVILKNGLTVLVRRESSVPLASVTTYVKAGYFDEEDRVSGISHVIEHMFFKGTATRGVGEMARETKAMGGYLNAYTSYDRTVYRTVVPSENIADALEIQADALWNAAFDSDELKREIEVVLQENNRKLDNPSAVASEKLYATAFEQHRMRRWRIGTPEGLRALTRDDVVAYYRRYYRPSNVILSIVGQVDQEQILGRVVKLYGAPAATEDPGQTDAGSPVEPEQKATRYASQRGPIEQTRMSVGFQVPGILSEETRALEVLGAILGTGRASILSQSLRDQKSLITEGSAGLMAFRDFSLFEIGMKTASPTEAVLALLVELEHIKRSGVTSEAVARAKASIARDYLHRFETVDEAGDELAIQEGLGDWKRSLSYLSDVEKVTRQNVVDAAQKYLTFANLSAFEYLPNAVTRSWSREDFQASVLDKVDAGTAQRALEPADEELPVTATIPKLDAGIAQDMVGTIQRRSMLRGPEIYILEDHRLPLVSFGIFFPGGRLFETPRNAGITELMLRTALRGSRQFDSAGIARRLENAGARIQIVNEPDLFGYILDGISGKMDQALEVFIDVLQQPRFDEQQVARERALQLAEIRNLRDDNFAYPVGLFMKTLFGEHSYARPALGTEEAVAKLSNTDLREWFRNSQRTVVPSVVIVGDTQGTALIAPLADALTNEDLTPRDISVLPRPEMQTKNRETVEPASRNQTALVYGFPGVNRPGNDRYALEVFANVVSGLGGRFFEAIREKQGLAYTVRTTNTSFAKSGAVFTYTAFSPEKESEVRAALDREYEKLRKEGITSDELRKAIAYTVGDREIALQTRQAQVLEFARAIHTAGGINAVARHREGIESVTVERVKAVIEQYLKPAELRLGIVRGGN